VADGHGSGYQHSPEIMVQSARMIDDAHVLISGQLATLTDAVDTMMSGWQSESASAFAAVHREWDQQTRKLNETLTTMAAALRKTDAEYRAHDTSAAQTFGGIVDNL